MPYEEFLGWMNYLEKRPIDWRDDDRTYRYLQTQGVKEKPWKIFASLAPIYKPPEPSKDGRLNSENLKNSYLFNKILSAKKGDKLDL